MKVVGITGGIGSGKSTVSKIFGQLGVSIYDSDTRAKALYSESKSLKEAMILEYGADIYAGNEINRAKLAEIVFNNKSQLAKLNSLVHPLLQQDFDSWKSMQISPYVIREAAILVESGAYKTCDFVIVVTAHERVRIARVVNRDKASKEQVHQRISNQITDKKRLEYADFEINNSGSDSLIEQVLVIHNQIQTS
jgi:dephospho-CoA kinase